MIQGSGPLGILATGMAATMGARRVITLGAPAARLELAGEFGADELIAIDGDQTFDATLARVRELTEGRGADVVFEFSGHPDAFAQGLEMVRSGGRYMVAGQTSKATTTFRPSAITLKNVHVQGSLSADISHYHKALQFISKHQQALPFHRMITRRYALGDVNAALAQMARGAEIKPLVLPWSA